jgi:hypothetical protein
MADAVSDKAAAASSTAEPAPFVRPNRPDVMVNQRRFGLAYLVLSIGIGVAVGLGIVLIGRGSHHAAATKVTAFEPSRSGELGAKEIARHVGHKYRLANGHELAGVVGERPNYQNLQMFNYLIRPHDAQYPNDIEVFRVGNGIMYSMCGYGQSSCGIGNSNPTTELLKREALELAFDTFRSDPAVETVTTLLPPAQQSGVAVIFRRNQLTEELRHPLSSLLPEPGPLKPGSINKDELQRIDLIVAQALFVYDAQIGPDGNPVLRLDPLG